MGIALNRREIASQTVKPDDRREHPRAGYRGRVWMTTARGTYWGRILDVSEGGLLVDPLDGAPQSSSLRVGFDLPGRGRVVAQAALQRTIGGKLALRFTEIDVSSRASLDNYIKSLAAD